MTCSGSTVLMLCWFLTVLVLFFAQVLYGDTMDMVVRDQPKGGPPLFYFWDQLCLIPGGHE